MKMVRLCVIRKLEIAHPGHAAALQIAWEEMSLHMRHEVLNSLKNTASQVTALKVPYRPFAEAQAPNATDRRNRSI
jgi:hypothetical protein